ncbi:MULTISPECIES: hypothetical protein [Atlantibacter]|uniref:hypothetical protein n=1 Tax=Atlantibacter TaxID=1903434 RepID=UPI001FCB1006|nr:hypothetical protein [Atlantibacter subterranea]
MVLLSVFYCSLQSFDKSQIIHARLLIFRQLRLYVAQGDFVDLDIAEAVDIIRQGGRFVVNCEEGRITSLERVREKQHLLTMSEFLEMAVEAGFIDLRKPRLP